MENELNVEMMNFVLFCFVFKRVIYKNLTFSWLGLSVKTRHYSQESGGYSNDMGRGTVSLLG